MLGGGPGGKILGGGGGGGKLSRSISPVPDSAGINNPGEGPVTIAGPPAGKVVAGGTEPGATLGAVVGTGEFVTREGR